MLEAAAVLLHHGGKRQHLVDGLKLHEDALGAAKCEAYRQIYSENM